MFAGLYHCAIFGWNGYSSFDDMQVVIFCELGLKAPILAPKGTSLVGKKSYDLSVVNICPPVRLVRVANWPETKKNDR